MIGEIIYLDSKQATAFILPRHYAGRRPQIKHAFGWKISDKLTAVCTFGIPASRSLCVGVCGLEFAKNVIELNRVVSIEPNLPLSSFIAGCLRRLSIYNYIVVSYADTDMGHVGKLYQATNFIYTGLTKSRTDKYTEGNKHSRHYSQEPSGKRKLRSAKHRYVYFATKSKSMRRIFMSSLSYSVVPYPQGIPSRYVLGVFQQPKIIADEESMATRSVSNRESMVQSHESADFGGNHD